jgi:hypothetical protein
LPPGAAVWFAPPTLETVVLPRRPADKGALHTALTQLAEQDPPIDPRQDDTRPERSRTRSWPPSGSGSTRPRTDHNPPDRKEDLLRVMRRVGG